MGSRICKMIGYGMPVGLFNFHFQPDHRETGDRQDTLDDILIAYDKQAGDPLRQDILDELQATGHSHPNIRPRNHPETPGKMADLYQFIGGENKTHVLFIPMLGCHWGRYDDDIDYVEETFTDPDRETVVIEREYGFYPWGNSIRDAVTNVPVQWDHTHRSIDGKRPSTIVPDVPDVLRYWLMATGVMNKNGIDALRPMYAKWWS